MFDETKAPYFKDLPLWLQRDIKAQQVKLLEQEKNRQAARELKIERKCAARGWGLDPTRGEMALPPHRRSRRAVGDFSLGWEE